MDMCICIDMVFVIESKTTLNKSIQFNFTISKEVLDKIYFSSHEIGAYGLADAILTPCFDESGLHGEPEEIFICSVESAHVYAHYYNPYHCAGDGKYDFC